MTDVLLEWRGYRYFPYERDFARQETERLFRTPAREAPEGLIVPADSFRAEAADRLTYVARARHPSGAVVVPRQARLEASANTEPRERQATRYSAHGLHEYRGKFNPQVVRAIGNMLGLAEGASILDPFCGSGTTLLECAHAGWSAHGLDRNPLAVRIANAKLRALRTADGRLQELADAVIGALSPVAEQLSTTQSMSKSRLDAVLGTRWEQDLPELRYLKSWFPLPVLGQVVAVQRELRRVVPTEEDRAIFEVILSDHLRDASLQEPADLRIRRRKDAQPNYALTHALLDAIPERIARVVRARTTLGAVEGQQRVSLDDVRAATLPADGFDAIISSPPYETALPYIDTQRLSLVLFGDVPASDVQSTERELIGAREIGTRERRAIEGEIRTTNDDALPREVLGVCQELLAAAEKPGNGFRRVNRPALTYRYFQHMRAFFINVRPALRAGGQIALVVGPNRTTLGGQEFVIDTPRLLAAVAVHCGYALVGDRAMDTYARFDVHRRNSIDSERLIVLAAP